MLAELGIDSDDFASLIWTDVRAMVSAFADGPANRDVYWLAIYADPVAAELLVHIFTEHAWQAIRHSPAYASLDERSLNAPFDGVRWSSGDCPVQLHDWSEEVTDTCAVLAVDEVHFIAGRPLTEDEESELWAEFDDVVLSVVDHLAVSDLVKQLHRTPAFFVSSCGDDVQPDSLARRVRQSIGPERFKALFPNECMLPPELEPATTKPHERGHAILDLAMQLAAGEHWDRWRRHSQTLTGLEDELVAMARAAPHLLSEIRDALPSSTVNWSVGEALFSAVDRIERTGAPELRGW